MRTTVTLDSDVEQLVRERMEAKGVSFKVALNDANRIAADLEDLASSDKLATGR